MRGVLGWLLIVVGTILAYLAGSWLLLALVDGAAIVLLWDKDYGKRPGRRVVLRGELQRDRKRLGDGSE